MEKQIFLCAFMAILALSCKDRKKSDKNNMEQMKTSAEADSGSFAYDLKFLKKWDSGLIVLQSDESEVAVSSKYQAKVFTSTAKGKTGKSLGWINYSAFSKTDQHMNAYGGENRFWLGPEGNAFSLYFEPGDEMVFENWKTPAPIDTEAWKIQKQNDSAVVMESNMELKNYAGNQFKLKATRTVTLLSNARIEETLGVGTSGVSAVAYRTENTITNTGDHIWTEKTGAPCIWILDMFPPSDRTTIFIPYNKDVKGHVATTDYFGQIPEERISYEEGMLFFKADGKSRGKLGIPPKRATHIAGSFDGLNNILTITVFDVDAKATYLNQEWNLQADPFEGDAINAYNDGPLDDGSQMGPFYELESVSPAAFLAPAETMGHNHTVYHFIGETKELDKLVKSIFGTTIENIANAL